MANFEQEIRGFAYMKLASITVFSVLVKQDSTQ